MDWLQQYFVEPITHYGGYNLVNTAVYLVILVVAAYIIFRLLDKRVKFDFKFALAVLPFVLLGGSARVIEDLHVFTRSANPLEPGFYTLTPGIYIAVGLFTIAALLLSLFLAKKFRVEYWKPFAAIGIVSFLPFLAFDLLRFQEWTGFFEVVALAVLISLAVWSAMKKWKPSFGKDKLNLLAIAGQALDGSATFVSTQFFSCGEQHVVSNVILQYAPWLFPILKVALIAAVMYLLDSELKNENARSYIKTVLIILGFAPGLRDLITLAVGTCG
ncbi:MAG: DUF63 family protein [Candidatus Diapherotrites archaeon]